MKNRRFRFNTLVVCQLVLLVAWAGAIIIQENDNKVLALLGIVLLAHEILSLAAFDNILNGRQRGR